MTNILRKFETTSFNGDIPLCFGFNEGIHALLHLLIEAFSLYKTVVQKFDVIWCWKRQQSDINETDPSGNMYWC